MAKIYQAPEGKDTLKKSAQFGIGVSVLLFLAIPITQLFLSYDKTPEAIDTLEMAPPPPPPPLEEEKPPPPPEEEEPPPELDTPPPPITLEQLDMALEPGIGNSLAGDFALPTFDVNSKDLGGLDIFDISDLENKPMPRRQASPRYPPNARRQGLQGRVTAEFIIDERGDVMRVTITRSSDPVFEKPTIDAIRNWKFTPGEKDGRKVKTRTRVTIPYTIS
jgi:protein TonB